MEAASDVRPSFIAGQWYPADPDKLAKSVDQYIQSASLPAVEGDVIAIVAPHAGHLYSGPVAGFAFAALCGMSPEIVAVASPMHHPYYQRLLTTAHSAYATPLGLIPVDQEAVASVNAQLVEELGFGLASIREDPEHSLEIELPFLQRALEAPFTLLPVMLRDQSAPVAHALGRALAQTLKDRRALLVASTDLSHFYPQEVADSLDAELLREVEAFDPKGVLEAEKQGRGFACGKGALAAVLWAAKDLGANHVQVLRHATSGDVTGDYGQVVGYGAAVVTRRPQSE